MPAKLLAKVQRYFIWLAILLTVSSKTLLAGTDSTSKSLPYNVRASYNLGFLMAHRAKMQHLPKELAHGFEISFEKQAENKKDWEKLYNNPTVGVSFVATGTGNYDILGTAFGLNGYILIPIVQSNRFSLKTSWGWGLGYLSKKFDQFENHRNNAIGSKLNLFAAIKLMSEFNLSDQLTLTAGATFHHWSNSAFKYPNLGLNIPSANLGLMYKFQPEKKYGKLSKAERKAFVSETPNEFSVIPSIGFKAYNDHDNSSYPAYTLEFNYSRLWSAKYKVSAGLDLFYNTAYAKEIEQASNPGERNNSAFQVGTNVCYHQTIGDFSIIAGLGVYLFDETLQDEPTYVRFGTRYVVKDHIVLSAILHTHAARADHFKIGIGYKFRK